MGKNSLMAFEICGKLYELVEYDSAIMENESELFGFISLLQEFPYSVKNIRNEDKTKQMPVYIIYNGKKTST